jgi:hypothetical protein
MIGVPSHERHKGIASVLYGMGREMARVKPRHSIERTTAGDKWAKEVSKKYGGKVPKKNVLRDE